MIHARLTDGQVVHQEKDFDTIEAFEAAVESAASLTAQNLYWESDNIGWCENPDCNHCYERPGVVEGRKGFCCAECAEDFGILAAQQAEEHALDLLCGEYGPPDSAHDSIPF